MQEKKRYDDAKKWPTHIKQQTKHELKQWCAFKVLDRFKCEFKVKITKN
jgi:hypothetical protein